MQFHTDITNNRLLYATEFAVFQEKLICLIKMCDYAKLSAAVSDVTEIQG